MTGLKKKLMLDGLYTKIEIELEDGLNYSVVFRGYEEITEEWVHTHFVGVKSFQIGTF